MYHSGMRVRGNRVRVYSGSSYTLRFTAATSGFSWACTVPLGQHHGSGTSRLGRRPGPTSRMSGLMWRCRTAALKLRKDIPARTAPGMRSSSFTLTSDVEETSTRSEDISLDYDFFHPTCWRFPAAGTTRQRSYRRTSTSEISRLFPWRRGTGFSILYYQDVDSWSTGQTRGHNAGSSGDVCGLLGQEMRLWEWLPKQI